MSFFKEVTVIIPLYNKDKYIARAVNSVLKQSYSNFELIIINDGSTDNGANEVQKIKDSRIKIIHQDNQGVSKARNRGIKESKAKLVAFLDADDEWKPIFLETIIKLKNKYPYAGLYATAYEYKYWNGKANKAIYNSLSVEFNEEIIDNYFRKCLKDPLICSSSVAIPKNIFLKVGNFDENLSRGEDLDMWFRIALSFPIAFNNDICVSYYKGENKNIYNDTLKVIVSKSHYNQETRDFVNNLKNKFKKSIEFIRIGSSLKLCLIAEAKADVYPRLAPTMEWDIAAGQAILEQAGGEVVEYNTQAPLKYNKENLLNPWFMVKRTKKFD